MVLKNHATVVIFDILPIKCEWNRTVKRLPVELSVLI